MELFMFAKWVRLARHGDVLISLPEMSGAERTQRETLHCRPEQEVADHGFGRPLLHPPLHPSPEIKLGHLLFTNPRPVLNLLRDGICSVPEC